MWTINITQPVLRCDPPFFLYPPNVARVGSTTEPDGGDDGETEVCEVPGGGRSEMARSSLWPSFINIRDDRDCKYIPLGAIGVSALVVTCTRTLSISSHRDPVGGREEGYRRVIPWRLH